MSIGTTPQTVSTPWAIETLEMDGTNDEREGGGSKEGKSPLSGLGLLSEDLFVGVKRADDNGGLVGPYLQHGGVG